MERVTPTPRKLKTLPNEILHLERASQAPSSSKLFRIRLYTWRELVKFHASFKYFPKRFFYFERAS